MATDTSIPGSSLESGSYSDAHTDAIFAAEQQDSVFDTLQIAQADGAAQPAAPGTPQQVAIPAGADVVRVPVQPGDVLVLSAPFTGEAEILGRIGDGNLAIRVGDVTVILQGYVDANQQVPVTVETANGAPIDVATMLASTDPTIDIQTAAGPGDQAAGPQGADNSGALLTQFGPGAGLGGFAGVGAQDQTELSYGLIDNSIRNDFADTLLANGPIFGFSAAGPLGPLGQAFLRDPANSTPWTSYQDFADHYFSEGQGNWADFFGTMSEAEGYLESLHQQADVHTSASPATVLLTGIGNIGDLTSNGMPLFVVMEDGNQTAFIYREGDDALVAVVHVSVDLNDPTTFHIDSYLINRIDDFDGDGNPADSTNLNVNFNVYPGEVAVNSEVNSEQESQLPPGGLPGTAVFEIADDAPLMNPELQGFGFTIEAFPSPTVEGTFNFNFGADGALDADLIGGGGNSEVSLLSSVTSAVELSLKITHPEDGNATYLEFQNGALVSSSLTSGGSPVDVVETHDGLGHTILTGSINSGATVVFTITVTDATGDWTFALQRPLDNPDTDEVGWLDRFQFELTATITDDDRDVASGSESFYVNDAGVTVEPPLPPPEGEDQDPASYSPGTLVYESALSTGSDPTATTETTVGKVTIIAGDGVSAINIAGVTVDLAVVANTPVIHGTYGDLTVTGWNPITGELTYSYTLLNSNPNHSDASGNDIIQGEDFVVVATDGDGDPSDPAHVLISIVDDVPTAVDDSLSNIVVSGTAQVVGNILTNDSNGADGGNGPKSISDVVGGTPAGSGAWDLVLADGSGTVHVAADGTVTFTANPGHDFTTPDNITFDYTIVDGDGDTSTATASFTASVTRTVLPPAANLAVDESQLPTGSHGGGGSLTDTQTVTLPDGFTVTNLGVHVLPNGTLTVSQAGSIVTYTYVLSTAYDDGTTSVSDGRNVVDGTLTGNTFDLNVTGPFGQTGTIAIDVTIKDDVPSAFNPDDQSLLNGAGGVITGSLEIAGHTGADGYGSIVFSGGTDNSKATLADGTTPITSGGKDVLLTGFGTDMLTGYVDANGNKSVDKGEEVFTVKLDGADDQYTFTHIKAIDDGSHLAVVSDFSDIKAGKQDWYGVGANGGTADSKDLLYTPLNPSTDTVNTSSKDLGSNDQWLDGGEGLRIDFVKGLTGDFDTNNGFDFAHHYQVTDFQFTIVQTGGKDTTSVRLTAADVTKDNNVGGTTEAEFLAQTIVAITAGEVQVLRGVDDVTDTLSIDYQPDGSVIIHGLEEGDVVQVHDDGGFDRLSVDSVGDKQFSIGESKVLGTVGGTDLDIKFETTLKDGDGDTSSGQYIEINLQTNDGESHTFHGGPGDDTMKGGSGSDFIFGDAGNDTLLYDSKDTFNGGAGFDRVLVEGGGNSITYTAAKFIGIEMIDLGDGSDRTAGGQNTLALSAADVIAANGSATAGTVAGHQINFFVIGDTAGPAAADHDNVVMTGFGAKLGTGTFVDPITNTSHTYDVYATVANPAVKVAIEQNLDVT